MIGEGDEIDMIYRYIYIYTRMAMHSCLETMKVFFFKEFGGCINRGFSPFCVYGKPFLNMISIDSDLQLAGSTGSGNMYWIGPEERLES